jgi:uncharacterized NAD-dependent epimerase/dehydratase family protein
MALIHGGQPDALILCHEPTRTHMRGLPEYNLPSLKNLNDTAQKKTKIANPRCKVIGISVNTQNMKEAEAKTYIISLEKELNLPATDPFRFGAHKLVDALANLN